jgi:ACT domain-containing protein
MRLEVEVELPDVPGELSRVLDVVRDHGGNVLRVVHRRDEARGDRVPVEVALEVAPEAADRLVDALADETQLLSSRGQALAHPFCFLLVGHVFEAGVRAVTDALFERGCRVHGVEAAIRSQDRPSAVLVDVSADDPATLEAALKDVEDLARDHDLTVLRELPEEGP